MAYHLIILPFVHLAVCVLLPPSNKDAPNFLQEPTYVSSLATHMVRKAIESTTLPSNKLWYQEISLFMNIISLFTTTRKNLIPTLLFTYLHLPLLILPMHNSHLLMPTLHLFPILPNVQTQYPMTLLLPLPISILQLMIMHKHHLLLTLPFLMIVHHLLPMPILPCLILHAKILHPSL